MVSGKKGSSDGFDTVKQKILDYFVKKHRSGSDPVTTLELSTIVNKNIVYVRMILRNLEDANLIERVEQGKPNLRLTSTYLQSIQQTKPS
jgi:predicted transcriptional regulator